MTLPTIIIATRVAIKSVPPSIKEAALGVGASRMQAVFHHVLPLAMPGILTGTIIGLAHALGETAPLLLIGMVAFVKDFPGPLPGGLFDPATALPVQVYNFTQRADPAFVERASGAIIVLLVFLVVDEHHRDRPAPAAGTDLVGRMTEALAYDRPTWLDPRRPDSPPPQATAPRAQGDGARRLASSTATSRRSSASTSTSREPGHRAHRPLRLRQVDLPALHQPDERHHPDRPRRRLDPLDEMDIHDPRIDVVELRARVGMVFQKPNPFPKSIFENVAYGPRIHGMTRNKAELEALVTTSLRRAGLWNEVKDRLHEPGTGLSGGQQQRLCIARAIATRPEVLLMDEPCSALDPIATAIIEELIDELRANYTIVIVTHSMQQAARVSQRTAFFHLGKLIEDGPTADIFSNPREKQTEDYITGKIG